MKRKFHYLLAVSIGVILLLSACGEKGEGESESDGQVTLDFWVSWTPGEELAEKSRKLIKEYESENDVNINIQELEEDMVHDKLVTGVNAGDVPDVSWGLGEWAAELNNMDAFMDLTELMNDWEEKENIEENTLDAVTINDKIVGVPFQTGPRALMVHDEKLEDADIEKVPETWDELIEKGKKYNEKTGEYLFGLTGTSVRAPQEMIGYFAQNNLELATEKEDGKFKNTWNDDPKKIAAAAGVFNFYKELFDNNVVNPDAKTWDYDKSDTNFATGDYALEVSGNWMSKREDSNPDEMEDVSIAEPPHGDKSGTFLEVKPLYIFKDSNNKKEAWKFTQFLLSKEFQEETQPANSPRKDISEDNKWIDDFNELNDIGTSFPPVSLGDITKNMEDALAKVLQDNEDPEEAAKWLSDQINSSLETSGELSDS